MAAAVLQEELERAGLRHVTVASAGTGGWHVGDPADRRAQAALERKGYRTEHAAQQFRTEWFDDYDLIVAMDRDNVSELRRVAPTKGRADTVRLMLEFHPDAESLDVPDPYYGAASDFGRKKTLRPSPVGRTAGLARSSVFNLEQAPLPTMRGARSRRQ